MRSKRRYEIWTGVKGDDKHGGIYLYKYEADENKLLLVRQEPHHYEIVRFRA